LAKVGLTNQEDSPVTFCPSLQNFLHSTFIQTSSINALPLGWETKFHSKSEESVDLYLSILIFRFFERRMEHTVF
jgi:hypothetical protein